MKNLVKQFDRLTDIEVNHGKRWYVSANDYAQFLADKYDLKLSTVCGIISALSPATSWERNKLETELLIQSNLEGFEVEPFKFTTYGTNVLKAQRIHDGENPDTLFNPKTGAKTFNFYHNILHPDSENYCTIDRHAIYAVMGNYNKLALTPKQYGQISDHYKKSAKKVGLIPCQFQAAIWVGVQNNLI